MKKQIQIMQKSAVEPLVFTRNEHGQSGRLPIVAIAGSTAVGLFMLSQLGGAESESSKTAVENVKQAVSSFYVLEEGVNVRTTPNMINDGNSGDNNIAFTVGEGELADKRLLVKLPVKSGNNGFIGFDNPLENGTDLENTVWVKIDDVVEQGKASEYPYGKAASIPVLLQEGYFVADGNPELPIADVIVGTPEEIAQQLPKS